MMNQKCLIHHSPENIYLFFSSVEETMSLLFFFFFSDRKQFVVCFAHLPLLLLGKAVQHICILANRLINIQLAGLLSLNGRIGIQGYIDGIPHPVTVDHRGCRTKFGKLASYILYHNGNKDKTFSPQIAQIHRIILSGEGR